MGLDGHHEGHRSPTRARSGDPLVVGVREAAFEVGLYPDRPGLDEPGAVRGLGVEEITNSFGVDRVGRRGTGSGAQCV